MPPGTALSRKICIWDIVGRNGPIFSAAQDQRAKLLEYGIQLDLVPYTDERRRLTVAYLEAHRAYLRDEREELFPLVREHFDDEALQMLAESLPEGAAAKLESLQESYPELYSELCAAPDPMV